MQIKLFGIGKDIVGKSILNIEEPLSNTVELKKWLISKYPQFEGLSSFALAVNFEVVHDNQAISENDEIAILPPVSGG